MEVCVILTRSSSALSHSNGNIFLWFGQTEVKQGEGEEGSGGSACFALVLARVSESYIVEYYSSTAICSNRVRGKRVVDRKNRFLEWKVMIRGDVLTSERTVFCDLTYLFSCDHGYNIHPLFPHHLPEVMARVWQRPLGSNVVPLLSTYSNLGVRRKKKNTVSAQILSSVCARTAL